MKECPACRRCFPDDINHCPQDGDATLPSLLGDPILDARYQLERRLGQGGMGVVFQARHIFLKTQHAIKVILPDLVGNDPMLVTRFRQEALAAAAIKHPNIIAVTDFGVVRGTMPFLVMEFVNGRSLQEIMAEEGAMPAARAFELICATASGVAAAHRQNIVHRDLKPLNIMVCENTPVAEGLRILDFGLAKIRSGELLGSFVQAKTSGLMGSPFYMAPEQWSDEEPDSRADIYSLGIILYQMLGGDVPFKGSSIPSIMKKHLTESPPPLKSMGVSVPPEIEAVVRHALSKDPAERTPSVEKFLEELRDAVNSASAALKTTGDSPEVQVADPNRTTGPRGPGSNTGVVSVRGGQTQVTGFETNYDAGSGAVSSPILTEQLKQASITDEALKREQEAKERFAREALASDAEERKRRLGEESERQRKEREEREEQDRQHKEQLARVAKQAEELEQKLSRLATSMVPQGAAVIDPEVTQIAQRANQAQQVGGATAVDIPTATWQQNAVTMTGGFPGEKRSPALLIGLAMLLILVVGAGVGGYFLLRPKQVAGTNGNANGRPNGPTSPTDPPVAFKPEMVEIPGGTFQMGRNDGPPQERPAHAVTVKTFFMEKTEVTNSEYAEFLHETNHAAPEYFHGGKPPFGQELWPVVSVSVDDAKAFAEWRSKRDKVTYRLPTEEEWEYAARGGDQDLLYPWGNDWVEGMAVVNQGFPKAVGSLPGGKSRWGNLDMYGNVWEWTTTVIALYPGNEGAEFPPQYNGWIIKRGGSFTSIPGDKRNPITNTYRDFAPATTKHPTIGFRLVRSAS
jgi:serine/threonine protein kinase/formylglycine-generating enzyme required for sulfatase activity